MYLFDTNVWGELIRRHDTALAARAAAPRTDQVVLSPVVLGELMLGYCTGDPTPVRRAVIDHIMGAGTPCTSLPRVPTAAPACAPRWNRRARPLAAPTPGSPPKHCIIS